MIWRQLPIRAAESGLARRNTATGRCNELLPPTHCAANVQILRFARATLTRTLAREHAALHIPLRIYILSVYIHYPIFAESRAI